MGREAQPPHSRLTPRLEADLPRINFYRFCQLLEKRRPGQPLMGGTSHPADDPVRFYPHPGMGFPASELKAVEYDEADDSRPPVIRTTFMGLYGVDSPLPTAYLDDIAQHREGHEALQGLLDIFSHRIMTQFYRIWRKYSWPATFEPGGTDRLSQSLLGLAGLGIPGTTQHIASPASRFLALTGVLRQPGKTQQGIQALVTLLAPETTVRVSPYSLRPVAISQPLGFYGDDDFFLDGNTPLGDEAMDASSQLLVALTTDNPAEAQGWKPDGPLFRDFLITLPDRCLHLIIMRIKLCSLLCCYNTILAVIQLIILIGIEKREHSLSIMDVHNVFFTKPYISCFVSPCSGDSCLNCMVILLNNEFLTDCNIRKIGIL